MHIRFLAHGVGNPYKASSYLTQAMDAAGAPRPVVQVLRGSPQLVAAYAATLSFVHKYTSGVIAWAPEDTPTGKEVEEVLDDFERTAFAGLEPDQYCWTAVSHGDHVHVLVARAELTSGKSMNIAPPGWQKTFDPLRDYWNYKMGWARPDDPLRMRLTPFRRYKGTDRTNDGKVKTNASELPIEVGKISEALDVEPDPRELLTEWITEMVISGAVRCRGDVVSKLISLGEITRQSDKFVSIKLLGQPKAIRLKGAIFEKDFDRDTYLKLIGEVNTRPYSKEAPNEKKAAERKRDLEERIQGRVQYNRVRYKKRPAETIPLAHEVREKTVENSINQDRKGAEDARIRSDNHASNRRILESARMRILELVELCRAAVDSVSSNLRIAQSASAAISRAREALKISKTAASKIKGHTRAT